MGGKLTRHISLSREAHRIASTQLRGEFSAWVDKKILEEFTARGAATK